MTDINMEDIKWNSPVVIPPIQEQQQQQTLSRTNHSAGEGGQLTKKTVKDTTASRGRPITAKECKI